MSAGDSKILGVVSITEDEAALYDRQIRLWGLEAQQKMRNATILISGLRGLAAETIKNIVLAGIGKLILVDSSDVLPEDLGAGFLFREEDVGKKRVISAQPHVKSLNPLVEVEVHTSNLLSSNSLDSLLNGVHLVCVTDSTREEMIRINDICRQYNILFYAGGTYGLNGYIFNDLLSHKFISPDRSAANKQSSQPKVIKQSIDYVPLTKATKSSWKALSKRETKDSNAVMVFSVLALWEYLFRIAATQSGNGVSSSIEVNIDELEVIANDMVKEAGVNSQVLKTVPRDVLESVALTHAHEFSPVCAIVGGKLAQDILKALSGRESPYANFLVFDGRMGTANVARLGL